MRQRTINAWEALRDIVGGMDKVELREKYRLTERGLHDLFKGMVEAGLLESLGEGYTKPLKRKVMAEEMVRDIRSGMNDSVLMEKYRLAPPLLGVALKLLSDRKFIGQSELDARQASSGTLTGLYPVRAVPRYISPFAVTVRSEDDPRREGKVFDVSSKGIGTIGLEAVAGETSALTILGDEYGEVFPFSVEATCRWVKRIHDSEMRAGFEIVKISYGSRRELQNWIRLCLI
jgi:hypothetical protein